MIHIQQYNRYAFSVYLQVYCGPSFDIEFVDHFSYCCEPVLYRECTAELTIKC